MKQNINPFNYNPIAKQIVNLLKDKNSAFFYPLDDLFLNRYFISFLASELIDQKSYREENVFSFDIFGDLKNELIHNTNLFNEKSNLGKELVSLKENIFLLYFKETKSISDPENLKILSQLVESSCYVLVLLPENFKTKDIVDNSPSVNLIDAFVEFNNNVPSPSLRGKMEYLEKNISLLNLSIDPAAKEFFFEEIKNPKIRFSHVINYLKILTNHELIKEEKNLIISKDTIPVLGSLRNSHEILGERFLKKLNTRFSNTEILTFFRFFIKKTPTEAIESSPGSKEEFIEYFKNESYCYFFLETAISNEYGILHRDDKDSWEGQEQYFINRNFLRFWDWLQNLKRLERFEANLYLKCVDLAIDFSKKNGSLLNEEQVAETSVLLNSKSFNAKWAHFYSHEFELTKNFLTDSKNHLIKTRNSQERKRRLRLKRARNAILFVGGAFLLSMIFLLIAYGEYNIAISAQLAEVQAKLNAEENAKLASINAQKAKDNAKIAEESALFAKEQEKIAKQKAIVAVYAVNQAKKNSILAQQKERESRLNEKEAQRLTVVANNNAVEAIKQKEFAERKTLQQTARTDAIRSLQMYENGDLKAGFLLAKEAFDSNKKNNGNIYEKEIIFSLIKGFSSLFQKNYSSDEQIKKIEFIDHKNLIICQRLDETLSFLDKKSFEVKATIKISDLKSFYIINDSKLILSFYNQPPQIFDFNLMQRENRIELNQNLIDVFSLSKKETLLVFKSELYSYDSETNKFNQIRFDQTLSHITAYKNLFLAIRNKFNLEFFEWDRTNNSVKTKLVNTFESEVSSISKVFEKNKIAIGLKNGSMVILNLETNDILFNNQIHKSKISSCSVTDLNDKTIITTTGFDGEIHVFYGKEEEWENNKYSSIPNISSHKDWITSSFIDNKNKTLVTASFDRTIKIWPLNPFEIINFK